MVRVVQVGLGPMGVRASREFVERRMGTLVGAVDPAFAGETLGELVTISPDLNGVGDWSQVDVALVTTCSALPDCAETFRALLDRGVHVVSSCEELAFPRLQHPELADELHEQALAAGRVLLGTGVNPGFLLDTLPVVMTGVCHTINKVVAGRVQDATSRRLPFQKKIGATLSPEAFEAEAAKGTLRHVGLPESLHFIAHYLSLGIDDWSETLEPVIAERDLSCELGAIPKGHAAGVRQVASGTRDGQEVVRLEFQAAIGQSNPRDWVTLDADPPVRLVIEGGVHGDAATTSILLNAIGSVREAQPGLRTMADVRPPRCQVNRGV